MIQEEKPVQVVNFVLQGAGKQFFAFHFKRLASLVLSANPDFISARDVLAKTRDAETAFFADLGAFALDNFRIDDDYLFAFVFTGTDIDDRDS